MGNPWGYVACFFAGLAVDAVPVFAPPAWTLLLLLVVKLDLNPWLASFLAASGSTAGRWILSRYMPKLAARVFTRYEVDNIAFIGGKLGGNRWAAFAFTFAYSLTPLSTTALFTAAGAARVDLRPVLPAFLLGKFATDAALVLGGRHAIRGLGDALRGRSDPGAIVTSALGAALILLALFVDWRRLLEKRELRFQFRILKGRGGARR